MNESGGAAALLRRYAPLVGLAAVAVVVSFVVRHEVFPAFSYNRDEPVMLWQYDTWRSGQLTATDGGAPQFFHPWLSGLRDGSFFSQYTPGWPLALFATGLVFGSPGFAIALAAALTVLGTYALARELTSDHALALVAAAVMTAAPFLVVQSGTYLGYLFSLGVGLWFAACLLAGVRRSRAALLIGAGALLGLVFLTRPYDGVLWGAPLAGYVALMLWSDRRRLLRASAWLAVGLLPLVVTGLAYNKRITGSFTEFPITAKTRLDTFGFGTRRIMPEWIPYDYTLWRALKSTAKNLVYLVHFMPGSLLGLGIAAVGLWLRRRDRRMLVLVGLGAAFVVGYFFFWGNFLSSARVHLHGPIYYVPLYGPLSILLAAALVAGWRRRPALGAALVVGLVVVTIPVLVDRLDLNRDISTGQERWRDSAESIEEPALVFVEDAAPYLIQMNPFSANDPGLDGRVVWAVDRGPENLDLMDRWPDRTPYLQSTRFEFMHIEPAAVSVARIRVARASTVSLRVSVTNPTDQPVVVAYLRIGDRLVARVLDAASERGAVSETEWTVGVPGATGPDVIPLLDRLGTVTVGAAFAPDEGSPLDDRRTEERLSYRLDGTTAEVMTPGRGVRVFLAKGLRPRHADTSREIAVVARAAGD